MPSLVVNGSVVLEKKKIFDFCYFIFAISLLSPLGTGRDSSFEKNNVHPRLLRMPCAKFDFNLRSGSGEKDFKVS